MQTPGMIRWEKREEKNRPLRFINFFPSLEGAMKTKKERKGEEREDKPETFFFK